MQPPAPDFPFIGRRRVWSVKKRAELTKAVCFLVNGPTGTSHAHRALLQFNLCRVFAQRTLIANTGHVSAKRGRDSIPQRVIAEDVLPALPV